MLNNIAKNLLVALLLLTPAVASAQVGGKAKAESNKIAVLGIKNVGGTEDNISKILTITATDAVRELNRYDVISMDEINTLLTNEKLKDELGACDDTDCATNIGTAIGAKYLLSGSLGKLGQHVQISFKYFDVPGKRVIASNSQQFEYDENKLMGNVRRVLGEIFPDVLYGDECLISASDESKQLSYHDLGEQFLTGQGGKPINAKKALEMFICEIQDYEDDTQEDLVVKGESYFMLYKAFKEGGWSGTPDVKRALGYLEEAKALYNADAWMEFTNLLMNGIGMPKNEKDGCKLYQNLGKDIPEAAYQAARCLSQGKGVKADKKKGCKMYKKAMDMGYEKAKVEYDQNCSASKK